MNGQIVNYETMREVAMEAWEDMIAKAPAGMHFPAIERETFIAGFSYGYVHGQQELRRS